MTVGNRKSKAARKNEIKLVDKLPQSLPLVAANQADRLIEMAINTGADVERLDRLLDLKERYDREDSRKQFTAALASFKMEDVLIGKDKMVGYTNKDGTFTGYKHASLGNIIRQAVPAMSQHGLSHRWDLVQDQGQITVTCILTHSGGHSEKVTLSASPDDTGKKNSIQQVASTVTYLERYTFLAITGLAVEDQDDDGVASGSKEEEEVALISRDEANTLHAMIVENDLNMPIFQNWLYKVKGITDISKIPLSMLAVVTDKLQKGVKDKK